MTRSLDQKISLAFLVALVLLAMIGISAITGMEQLARSVRSLLDSHRKLTTIEAVLHDLARGESEVISYATYGHPAGKFLWERTHTRRREDVARLERLTRPHPLQRKQISAITRRLARMQEAEGDLVRTVDREGTAAATQLLNQGPFPARVALIREQLLRMRRDEERNRVQLLAGQRTQARQTVQIIVSGSVVAIALVALSSIIIRLDMMKRTAAEQALHEANVGLEARVAERTRELALAHEAAENANRFKSEFLANMSHEMRNPLNAITGMAAVLNETELNRDQRKYVEVFNRASGGLLALINDILDLSKVEAGRMELEAIDFNLKSLLEETAEIMRARAESKGLELRMELADGVPPDLTGDSLRLRQVLINLIANAIKFTERGAVTLSVHPESSEGNAITLHFAVADTGPGIPADKLDSVFGEFEQADASVTRKYGGTGLGLTISQRLVALMGGRLWVESEVGHGSTFRFTAQFGRATAPARPRPEASLPVAADARPLRVLLADDSEDNQLLIRTYLKQTPYQLDLAEDGQQALEKAQQVPYDLVLMDNEMPVVDGLTATRRIRAWEREQGRAPVPIISLTAHAYKEDIERSLQAGCNAHLTKPLTRTALLQGIAAVTGALPASSHEGSH